MPIEYPPPYGENVYGMRFFYLILASALAVTLNARLHGDEAADLHGIAFFEKRIRPALVTHCYECHSSQAKELKGGLKLDTRADLLRGGSSGSVVVPGDVEASRLISAIEHAELKMPPSGKLSDSVIADFVKWVEIGAPDPRDGESRRRSRIDIEAARDYWALRPLQVDPPTKNETLVRHGIDGYIAAKRVEKSLKPRPASDKYTLLRRVFIDLVGLTPEPREIAAFINDDSPNAYEKVVDRLLASPRFGERWARHWLDVAQYADSVGIERVFPNAGAWRYRDYVIRALNQDKPFDRFVIEQLAGDLLPYENDAQRAEQIVATQFISMGPFNLVNQFKEQLRMDIVDNQVDKVGRVFMGLTFGCARCHDHKFDPLAQQDYYALSGIFQNVQIINGFRGTSGVFSDWLRQSIPEMPQEHVERQKRIELHGELTSALEAEIAAAKNETDRLEEELQAIVTTENRQPKEKELKELEGKLKGLEAQLANHVHANAPDPPKVLAASEPAEPKNARINIRGNALHLGEEVSRGAPRLLNAVSQIPENTSGRLQLARALVHPDNPIVPRVFVNRVWRHLFGAGIVDTVDNFGARGEQPSHPALLDFLAYHFVRGGWSVKSLIRELVLTSTYRLSSDHDPASASVDPYNRFLWRHSPRRLDVESLRDSVLEIGGSLSAVSGGPTLPPAEWNGTAVGQFSQINPAKKKVRPEVLRARTVFLPVSRSHGKFDFQEELERFDFPSPNDVTGKRNGSIVATQSLYLLNAPFVSSEAANLVERLLAQELEPQEMIQRVYLLAYGRPVEDDELRVGLDFLEAARKDPDIKAGGESGDPAVPTSAGDRLQAALARLCHTILISTEFLVHD